MSWSGGADWAGGGCGGGGGGGGGVCVGGKAGMKGGGSSFCCSSSYFLLGSFFRCVGFTFPCLAFLASFVLVVGLLFLFPTSGTWYFSCGFFLLHLLALFLTHSAPKCKDHLVVIFMF